MSSTAPAVSICIRGWRSTWLDEAIQSVLEQTYTDLELIVADDSGDLEPVVTASGDPRVRYHRNPRRMGVTANAAVALGLARGRYVGLLGDDDRLLPTYLEETVGVLEGDPEVGLVFTGYYLHKYGTLRETQRPIEEGRHDGFLPALVRHWPAAISATLMRREVWESGERELPLPEHVAPDVHIFVRAALGGWPFQYVNRPLAVVRRHEEQTSRGERYGDRTIAAWEQFEFDDVEAERLRRSELSIAYLARATAALRSGAAGSALADVDRARAVAPDLHRGRRLALRALARFPRALPAAQAVWRASRSRA